MPTTTQQVTLDTGPLTAEHLISVARHNAPVALAPDAISAIQDSRARLEQAIAAGTPLYGVNTGFGSLSRQRIEPELLADVQRNLLRSHAACIGEPLPRDVVRGTMLLLAASLARGYSGVRPELVQSIITLLNADITPVVPETGSVGASGDLAPLAHIALVLLGEGEATHNNKIISGQQALSIAKLNPLVPAAKEGLALINGTHLMAARGTLALHDAMQTLQTALIACAMSMDACKATDAFLDQRVHQLRNQPGQTRIAAALRTLLSGSTIVQSHRDDDQRVQDPYSFRCMPQVAGAALDTLEHCINVFNRELGAVTDNPLVCIPTQKHPSTVISAGNFHGMPLALALDCAAPALAHIAGISERRLYNMLAAREPESGLPAHLSPQPGLHSGYMIVQYTAAACCNELVHLANPASVANISTCAGMEDYNSFGPHAAQKLDRAVQLCRSVVAMELLCAAQALELHRPLHSGELVEQAHTLLRKHVPELTADRPPSPDIQSIVAQLHNSELASLCPIPPAAKQN